MCEALVTLRHHYLGSFSLDPEDVRNMVLELSWVFIKGQNCHELDFSSRGTKYRLEGICSSGPNSFRTHSLTHYCDRWSRNVGNYQSTRHYVPADGRPYLQRRRSLKSQTPIIYVFICINLKFIEFSGDQIKKNEMGRAGGTYWRGEMCIQCFDGDT